MINKMKNTNSHICDEKDKISRVMIAGVHSGVGKTTVALGVMSLLRQRGYNTQGFKAGPDYIDISHHYATTGNRSRNLDTWMMNDDACRELFHRTAVKARVSIIEGVMGLFDGNLNEPEKGSSAYLAKVLNTPVILVIDAKGMAQSAGAVALGFARFDPDVQIKGFILNRIGSENHFNAIKSSIENAVNIPVLGYLSKNMEIAIPERHLGLVPSCEMDDENTANEFCKSIADQMAQTLDVEKLLNIANQAGEFPKFNNCVFPVNKDRSGKRVKVAVAMDKAFHFYYQDNLELLEALGAELCYFSPLYDKTLPPEIDGVYIGGGFPELFAAELEANKAMRGSVKKACDKGVVVYAECGGMMYLLDKLVDCAGKSYIMCGVFGVGSKMQNRRQGLGYITAHSIADNILRKKGEEFRAHEFHWSSLIDADDKTLPFAYKIQKGRKGKTKTDGLFKNGVLASYTHIHFAENPDLAAGLLKSMGGGSA